MDVQAMDAKPREFPFILRKWENMQVKWKCERKNEEGCEREGVLAVIPKMIFLWILQSGMRFSKGMKDRRTWAEGSL